MTVYAISQTQEAHPRWPSLSWADCTREHKFSLSVDPLMIPQTDILYLSVDDLLLASPQHLPALEGTAENVQRQR